MAGHTFPLKTKFNSTSFSAFFGGNELLSSEITFFLDEKYEDLKNGTVRIFENDVDGFKVENKNFKFLFDDTISGITIQFMDETPIMGEDFLSYNIIIKEGFDPKGYGIEKPVYSSVVSAIPTVYDEIYGTCNYLDSEISSIECIAKLSNVNKLKLKLVSADSLAFGNIVLRFTCGSTSFIQIIPVKRTEEVVNIILPNEISGILKIDRLYLNENDTLQDNGIVISAIITEIKMENN